MSNDTKLEAKLHFFSISSFIGLEFSESGFSFEFGGGHTPPPPSCYVLYYSFSRTPRRTPEDPDERVPQRTNNDASSHEQRAANANSYEQRANYERELTRELRDAPVWTMGGALPHLLPLSCYTTLLIPALALFRRGDLICCVITHLMSLFSRGAAGAMAGVRQEKSLATAN